MKVEMTQLDKFLSNETLNRKLEIVKQSTKLHDVIPVHDGIMITCCFLASENTYCSLQYLFHIPPCAFGRIVPQVYQAIYDKLMKEYLNLKCSKSDRRLEV